MTLNNLILDFLSLSIHKTHQKFCHKEADLHSTDKREASQQSKGSSNSRQLIGKSRSNILGDLIKCRSVNIDTNDAEAIFPFII